MLMDCDTTTTDLLSSQGTYEETTTALHGIICRICNSGFKTAEELSLHTAVHLEDDQSRHTLNQCSTCNKGIKLILYVRPGSGPQSLTSRLRQYAAQDKILLSPTLQVQATEEVQTEQVVTENMRENSVTLYAQS